MIPPLYYYHMSKILITLLLLQTAFCNTKLNSKYESFLLGESEFSEVKAKEIYEEFSSPFHEKSWQRFRVFRSNLVKIRKHNLEKHSWTMGINDFTDLTYEQFAQKWLMVPQDCHQTPPRNLYQSQKTKKHPKRPAFHDWRNLDKISPVKNQGSYGSCWAFSAVGSLQAFWNINDLGVPNTTFSQQQLIDCFKNFENVKHQGHTYSAFQYIKTAGGIEGEDTYPLKKDQNQCTFSKQNVKLEVPFGSQKLPHQDQNQMAEKLYSEGPIGVSFVVSDGFQNYHDGVYSNPTCRENSEKSNHSMLIVGYGKEEGKEIWTAKNSWGKGWGQQGFVKVERGVNTCGISDCASHPRLFAPKTQKQKSSP